MSSGDRSLSFASLFWGVLGLFMLVSGLSSNDMVATCLGASISFLCILLTISTYLTNKPRLKGLMEYSSIIGSLTIILYGYIITGNIFLLSIATITIILMIIRTAYLHLKIRKI
ncbi:MAG: hypothetical protein QXX09_03260 [Candidatus Methanomethylicia archaeon]